MERKYLYFLFYIIHASISATPLCHITFEQEKDCLQPISSLPTQQYKHLNHYSDSSNVKDSLLRHSRADLKHYFDANNYSEKDILSCDILYVSDEFTELAKTYSGYENAITTLYKRVSRLCFFQRAINFFRGIYYPNLLKRVRHLYKELQAYQQVTTERAKSFAQQYDINLLSFFSQDSLLARNIYEKYIHILHQASTMAQHNNIMRDCIGYASHIGLEANKHGYIKQASEITDFCWSVLDYAQACGEGIYLGAEHTVHAIIHPVQTIKNSLIGIGILAHGLSRLTGIAVECAFLYVTDSDRYYIQKDVITNQLNMIINNTRHYLQITPNREIIKQGSAIITEGLLFSKIGLFAHNTARRLLPVAQSYVEYVVTKEPVACFADGGVIEIGLPKNIASIKNNIVKIKSTQILPTHIGPNTTTIVYSVQEIFDAIAKIEPNRIHHILTPITGKHAWSKICKNPLDWNEVKNIIAKVMLEGEIGNINSEILAKLLYFNNETIEVRYRYVNNKLSIVNAWVKTI